MTSSEIQGNYELETGNVIVERFNNIDPNHVPSVLVHGHAPFSWGKDPEEAVHNAVVLEEVAKIALQTYQLNSDPDYLEQELLDKHYLRKHGYLIILAQNNIYLIIITLNNLDQNLIDKHYLRKHGSGAYYGQNG